MAPWNSLSEDVVSAPSVDSFKQRLNKFWKDHPLKFDTFFFLIESNCTLIIVCIHTLFYLPEGRASVLIIEQSKKDKCPYKEDWKTYPNQKKLTVVNIITTVIL